MNEAIDERTVVRPLMLRGETVEGYFPSAHTESPGIRIDARGSRGMD
jgi:hypothetical protein